LGKLLTYGVLNSVSYPE